MAPAAPLAPTPLGHTRLQPTGKLATWSFILVGAAAVASAASVGAQYATSGSARALVRGEISDTEYLQRSLPYQGISVLASIVSLAAAVLTIVWLHRVVSNHRALNRVGTWSPVWAIIGWLLPPILFVIPYLVLREVWRASDPAVPLGDRWDDRPVDPLISVWFVLYGVAPLAITAVTIGDTLAAFSTDLATTAEALIDIHPVAVLAPFVQLAAAACWVTVGRRLTDRHRQLTGEIGRA